MENSISKRISVGSRQTSITKTSQYSKHLAIETQSSPLHLQEPVAMEVLPMEMCPMGIRYQ